MDIFFTDPEGNSIKNKSHLKYLGAQIAADGSIDSELGQKLGIAARDFKKLQQVWSHSSLSCRFKLQVYIACIVQKLLYGLEGAWVNAAGRRKLDGFHAKCLRRILGISPAFINRVSNSFILKELSAYPLSSILLERQLLYFGHVARLNEDSVLRQSVFTQKFILRDPKLKRGRPRNTWGRKILQHVSLMIGDLSNLQSCLEDKEKWKAWVRSYCRQSR